jgi:hypothetical protein
VLFRYGGGSCTDEAYDMVVADNEDRNGLQVLENEKGVQGAGANLR